MNNTEFAVLVLLVALIVVMIGVDIGAFVVGKHIEKVFAEEGVKAMFVFFSHSSLGNSYIPLS